MPQTPAYALNDSPAGLAAWILEKFREWSDCGGNLYNSFSRDALLTNVTLYWMTQTISSSFRIYREGTTKSFSFFFDRLRSDAVCRRMFSQGNHDSTSELGRTRLQCLALDNDAKGWPLRSLLRNRSYSRRIFKHSSATCALEHVSESQRCRLWSSLQLWTGVSTREVVLRLIVRITIKSQLVIAGQCTIRGDFWTVAGIHESIEGRFDFPRCRVSYACTRSAE